MTGYIVAGFDPARFWGLTPRLFALEMIGATKRAEQKRGEIWLAAMLPRMEKPPTMQEFMGGTKDKRSEIIRCVQAWDAMDRALMHRKN